MIRAYQKRDAAALTAVYNQLSPTAPYSLAGWQQQMQTLLAKNGRAWTLLLDYNPIGFVSVSPVPGLPTLYELDGFIAPAYQRQGWGSQLLTHVLQALIGSDVSQISFAVSSLQSGPALFLQKHHFFIEHEEWNMQNLLLDVASPTPRAELTISRFSRATAVRLFEQLYPASFSGTPWDQPFSRDEIEQLLVNEHDLCFLMWQQQPIGFVWLQWQTPSEVAFEPIGLIKAKQGQGYGRYFLQSLLAQLKGQGGVVVHVGVWRNNEAALHLYQSLGFVYSSSVFHLAYNIA